jgi:hypothetical protein
MAQREPSAAQAIWGHLRQGTPEPVKGRQSKSLAETMYPAQSGDQRLWQMILKKQRDDFRRGLREADEAKGKR